jgi:hypothetical protein
MDLLYGAIIGVVITELYNYLKRKYIRERKVSSLRKVFKNKFEIDNGIIALDHAIPYYLKENIHLRDSGKSLFIEIPSTYREELKRNGFESRGNTMFSGSSDLSELLGNLMLENSREVIELAASETAQDFLKDLNQGHTRFNNPMFGVYKIRSERISQDENSGFSIDFYQTDYFTHRTFVNIYNKYKDVPGKFEIKSLQDLNLYSPFLASFGLGNFLIINQGNGDEVIIGKRSMGVVVDKGKLHFSMNEAFSMNDVDEYGNPSFSACLFRGLEEELGISPIFKKYVTSHEFLDLVLGIDRLEMGITSIARIGLNDTFTFETLKELYSIAKDSKLETTSLLALPIKNIDVFLKENSTNVSQGCKMALMALNARYKAGYLREEV